MTTLTTGKDGKATAKNLPLGQYRVVEVEAPYGYVLNPNEQKVTFTYVDDKTPVIKESLTFSDDRQKLDMSVTKLDAEDKTPIAGAVFGLYADEDIKNADGRVIIEKGTLLEKTTSDENGKIAFVKNYPFAKYVARELVKPAGYVTNEEAVNFDTKYQGQDVKTAVYTSEYKNTPTTFEFTKTDITSGAELTGATLTVLDKDGNVVDTWTSDAKEAHVIKRLVVGETYTLREEFAPYGYLKAADIQFTVEDTGKVQHVEMKDEVPTGSIVINKDGEFVTDTTLMKGYWYDFIFNFFKDSLAGVTFDVYAKEDIVSADGLDTVYHKAGDKVATIVTNDKGIARIDDLPLGRYYLVETKTIDGFVLDDTPIEADLSYIDQNTKVVFAGMDVTNERQKVQITVTKTDSETKEALEGAVFGLFAKEDIVNKDGKVIVKADTQIERTVTGKDGKAALSNVPSSAKTLVVSFIGMASQEVSIKQNVSIILKSDTEMLDDVVVVAYGTAKKSSFTGSATAVSGEKIAKMQVSSVSKALEGAAAGVQVINTSGQPGENAKIRIRGIGSFSASSAPLYVVDGMPYDEESVNALNPADIESMSILKDAASAALYGSRAANGVVMITTKKGMVDKSKVTLDARWGVNTRGVPEYDIMKDQREYVLTAWNTLKNQSTGAEASEELIGSIGYNPFIGVANNAMVSADGVVSSAALRHNDDWADAALHNGMRQEYNLSLQGGNAKTTHFLSLGYLKDEGILRHTDFERISARANINHTVNKFIDINGNLAYARAEKNAGQSQNASLSNYSNAFMFTQQIAPIYPVYAYDENGNRIYDEEGNTVYDFGDGTYSTRMGGFSNQNVAANSGLDVHQTLNDNFNGRGTININIIDGLKATANIGYDLMNQIRTDHMNQLYGDAANVNGRTYKYNQRIESFTANQLLTYSKAFGHHNIDIMAGHESYSYTLKYQYTHKYNFYTIGNPEFNNAITMSDMNSYTQEHSMESFFGRVNYDFDNKYYLSASIRSDESSKFHPDHRRGTFWSVGGSWRLTQEEFLKDVEWLSNLKLKASYGTQGNDGILDINGYVVYQPYLKQYSVTNNNGDFSVVETYRGNKDLTWEKSKNLNIGLEAAFLNNRLKLETEYFLKKTSDMLYNMPYPISSGISYVPMNLLDMQNKGIEFTISATPIQTKDFIWNLSFNGTHYSNKILNLPEDKRENGIIHGTASLFRLMEGGSIYDLYTYEYAGVNPETGAAQWYMDEKDANGKVTGRTVTEDYTQASKYELGSTLPDFQGGFSTDFAYKGIDLSIATNFQIGGKIYDSMYSSFMHAGSNIGSNWHKDILNAWTPENKNTNVPIMDGAQNSNSQSSRFLINASFFNIRNISLGYTFPKEWMKAISASSARIYVSADNVALFSKRKGMDPRQYAYGYSAANYSAIRTLSFGINLNF